MLSIGAVSDILLTRDSGRPVNVNPSNVGPVDIQLPRQVSDPGALACKSLGVISPNKREDKNNG